MLLTAFLILRVLKQPILVKLQLTVLIRTGVLMVVDITFENDCIAPVMIFSLNQI